MLLIFQVKKVAVSALSTESGVSDFLSYLEKATGVPKTTIFTVFTSLFVFGLGILTNYIINKLRERNQRINYRRTISLLLDNLGSDCKKQHERTKKILGKTSILDNKTLAIQIGVLSPLFFLNKMDYSLFIKYYVRGCNKKIKTKAATKVFQIIGYTNIFESDTEEKVKSFLNSIAPQQEAYLKNIAVIEKFERELLTLQVKDYDFKTEANEIFKQWKTKNTDHNFRNSFTHLVSPFIRLLDRYNMEPGTSQLVDALAICHQSYSDMAHIDAHLNDVFKNLAIATKRVYRQIDVILRIFQYKRA